MFALAMPHAEIESKRHMVSNSNACRFQIAARLQTQLKTVRGPLVPHGPKAHMEEHIGITRRCIKKGRTQHDAMIDH